MACSRASEGKLWLLGVTKAATMMGLSKTQSPGAFGLTWEEIVRAIRAGKLQYREHSMYGNPWLRLLRREVEALVKKKHGDNYLQGSAGED